MEYIVKKINMIDILGMLLPGGLMLLLLEMDFEVLRKLKQYFEFEGGNLLWIAIFLCASYFLGMLLHELGSVIEKLIWRNPLTSPRVYAAVSTGLLFNYGDKVGAVEKIDGLLTVDTFIRKYSKQDNANGGQTGAEDNNTEEENTKSEKLDENHVENKKGRYWLGICWRFVVSLVGLAVVFYALGELTLLCYGLIILVAVGLCLALHWNYFVNFWKAIRSVACRDNMRWILRDERVIQKESITSEENSRKYGLFCGYYSLMRSVLVLMAILQICVNIQAGSSGSHLVAFYEMVKQFPAYPYLRYVVVAALVLRYWHYACAKFTYTYNGYINNKLFPKNEDKTTKVYMELERVLQGKGQKADSVPQETA